jgi:hypothetical protein
VAERRVEPSGRAWWRQDGKQGYQQPWILISFAASQDPFTDVFT